MRSQLPILLFALALIAAALAFAWWSFGAQSPTAPIALDDSNETIADDLPPARSKQIAPSGEGDSAQTEALPAERAPVAEPDTAPATEHKTPSGTPEKLDQHTSAQAEAPPTLAWLLAAHEEAWRKGLLGQADQQAKRMLAYAPLSHHDAFMDALKQAEFPRRRSLFALLDTPSESEVIHQLFDAALPQYLRAASGADWQAGELDWLAALAHAAFSTLWKNSAPASALKAVMGSALSNEQKILALDALQDVPAELRGVLRVVLDSLARQPPSSSMAWPIVRTRFGLAEDDQARLAMLDDPRWKTWGLKLLEHGLLTGTLPKPEALRRTREKLLKLPETLDAGGLFDAYLTHAEAAEALQLARELAAKPELPAALLRRALMHLAAAGDASERDGLQATALGRDAPAVFALEALQSADLDQHVETVFLGAELDDVRASALSWLAANAETTEERSSWIEKGLGGDMPSRVRTGAASLLDPENTSDRERLKELASSDRHARVRLLAINALGSLGDPELLPWFEARAASDSQSTIRARAEAYAAALRKQQSSK